MLILLKSAHKFSTTTFWKIMVQLNRYNLYNIGEKKVVWQQGVSSLPYHVMYGWLAFISILLPHWAYNVQVYFSTVVMAVYSLTLSNAQLALLSKFAKISLGCPVPFSLLYENFFKHLPHLKVITRLYTRQWKQRLFYEPHSVYSQIDQ